MGRVRGADQLPGPPLGEWLLHVLRVRGVAIVCGRGVRSDLSGEVLTLAAAQGWVAASGEGPFAALVVLRVLGTEEVGAEAERFAEQVVPGGLVIELGHPPALRPWHIWKLLRARPLRGAAELRAAAWLGFGLYGVEQWAPIDLPRVLVTCGRRRAIPRA